MATLYLGKDPAIPSNNLYYDTETNLKTSSTDEPTKAQIKNNDSRVRASSGPDADGYYTNLIRDDQGEDSKILTNGPIPGELPPKVEIPATPPASAEVASPPPDAPATEVIPPPPTPPAAADSTGATPPPPVDNSANALPPDTTKTDEAAAKIADQGQAASFSKVDATTSIQVANGQAMAINAATGAAVASMGTVLTQSAGMASLTPSGSDDPTLGLRVTISQEPSLGPLSNVTFVVSPTISENREAEYTPFQPLQHPGEILKYKGTSSRSWGVHGKLISRNSIEATQNLQYINMIRSWVMPFYGNGTGTDPTTKSYLGAPPPILTLTAYGPKMVGPVKCVLMSYNWDWPNDCDYIYAIDDDGNTVPFPVVVEVTLSLKESWSPAEYSKFNLMQYRLGNMSGAFGGTFAQPQSSATGSSNATADAASNPSAINTSAAQTTSTTRPGLPSTGNKLLGTVVGAAASFIKTKLGGH